ncbi:MAG: hypothetical protein IT521_02670 [Burkholderiales bacterium]|nr:hypothetical protein [Burkholderiales bacterium]
MGDQAARNPGDHRQASAQLQCDEPADFSTFRVGLFGLDKWADVTHSVETLERALSAIAAPALEQR